MFGSALRRRDARAVRASYREPMSVGELRRVDVSLGPLVMPPKQGRPLEKNLESVARMAAKASGCEGDLVSAASAEAAATEQSEFAEMKTLMKSTEVN